MLQTLNFVDIHQKHKKFKYLENKALLSLQIHSLYIKSYNMAKTGEITLFHPNFLFLENILYKITVSSIRSVSAQNLVGIQTKLDLHLTIT